MADNDALQNTVEQVNNEPPPPAPAPTVEDMDDAEVAAALAAALADEKGQTAPAPAPAAPAAAAAPAPAPAPSGTPAAPPAPADEHMIPKARYDEIRQREMVKDQELARLQGENTALKSFRPAAPASGAAPAAPAPAEPAAPTVASLRAEQVALAKQFDGGTMGLAEFTTANAALEDKIYDLREQVLAEKFKPAPQQQRSHQDLRLEERTQELEKAHPYTALITQTRDWDYLREVAGEQLVREGKWPADRDFKDMRSATDHLLFRERIAALTDTYGPTITGKTLTPAAAPAAAAPAQTQAQRDADALARARANKLDAAGAAPPDVNRLGTQTGPTEFSDAAIEAMGEDEIAALPASIRGRYLGNN